MNSLPDDYQSVSACHKDDLAIFDRLWDEGKPRLESWLPVKIQIVHRRLKVGDFPAFAGAPSVPVFSRRAADALHDLLAPSGELLRLDCKDGEYFAYNAMATSDALDWTASDVRYYSDGGVMWINSPVFNRRNGISSDTIFRIRDAAFVGVYVSDAFTTRVEQLGLVGCGFEQAEVI